MQQEVAIQHPEVVEHPNSEVNLYVNVVHKTLFGPERSHSNDSLQHFAESRKDGGTGVRFHPPKVTSRIEVPDGEALVHITDDCGGEQEEGEDSTVMCVNITPQERVDTHVTTRTEEKKVAKELFTAFKVPARDVSTVSMSYNKSVKHGNVRGPIITYL